MSKLGRGLYKRKCWSSGIERGFTLIEVLVSLGLASLTLGVVLSDIARDAIFLSRIEPSYRAMLVASVLAEKAAGERSSSSESGIKYDLQYSIEAQNVAADPRVFELKTTVTAENGRPETLSVYRLRNETSDDSGS